MRNIYHIYWLYRFSFFQIAFPHNPCSLSVGGADEHTRKDKAGAGRHQAASVLHPAVSTGEGHPPHKHETRTQETAGGDPGNEVSVIISLDICSHSVHVYYKCTILQQMNSLFLLTIMYCVSLGLYNKVILQISYDTESVKLTTCFEL